MNVNKNHVVAYTTWKKLYIGLYAAYYIQSMMKGGLNSMNNYPFDAMPSTNAQ